MMISDIVLSSTISLFFVLLCLNFAPCARLLDFLFLRWYGWCRECGDEVKGSSINLEGTYEKNKKNINIWCGTFGFV